MRFTTISRPEDGGSAFEDGEIVLESRHVADGVPAMLAADISGTEHITTGVGDPPFEALLILV